MNQVVVMTDLEKEKHTCRPNVYHSTIVHESDVPKMAMQSHFDSQYADAVIASNSTGHSTKQVNLILSCSPLHNLTYA